MTDDKNDAPPIPGRSQSGTGNMAGRIERLAKGTPPAPKGKGLVMILIGMAVVWAGIETFTKGSSAGQAIRDNHAHDVERPPVASPRGAGTTPAGAPAPGRGRAPNRTSPPVRQPGPGLPEVIDLSAKAPIDLPEDLPSGAALRLRATIMTLRSIHRRPGSRAAMDLRDTDVRAELAQLAQLVADAPEIARGEVRALLLEELSQMLRQETTRPKVYEAAAWLAQGSGEESEEPLLSIYLEAKQRGLAADRDAPAAITFLAAMPGGMSGSALAVVDRVILDDERPLHVRVLAAHARPRADRGVRLHTLAKDPKTHPALRDALAKSGP